MADLYEYEETTESFGDDYDGGYGDYDDFDGNGDLLTSRSAAEKQVQINYDQTVYMFHLEKHPADLGNQIVLSRKDETLRLEHTSERRDFGLEAPGAGSPVAGKHDLLKSVDLEIHTTYKGPILVRLPQLAPLAQEAYGDVSNASPASCVTRTIFPYEFENGVARISFLAREITPKMLKFLRDYPGQTAENIKDKAVELPGGRGWAIEFNNNEKSCLEMWYRSLHAKNKKEFPELRSDKQGMATMSSKAFDHCVAKATDELGRNFSFADVTSAGFSVEIVPLPTADQVVSGRNVGFSDFQSEYPLATPNQLAANGKPIVDAYAERPIRFSGRVLVEYKKVYAGKV